MQKRLKDVRATYIRDGGEWWGKPSSEKYLLSGMGRCDRCGKAVTVIGGKTGTGKNRSNIYYYGCSYHHTRGETVCTNNHRARLQWLDEAVIKAINAQVLTPEAIAYTVEKMAKLVEQELKRNPDKPRELEAEARGLRRELDRFMRLIADGKAPEAILAEIKRREDRLRELERERDTLQQGLPAHTPADIRRMCGERLARFKDLLLGDVPVARQALRKLLPEPSTVRPALVEGRRTLRFEGVTTLGPLFDPGVYKGLASPRGFQHRLMLEAGMS